MSYGWAWPGPVLGCFVRFKLGLAGSDPAALECSGAGLEAEACPYPLPLYRVRWRRVRSHAIVEFYRAPLPPPCAPHRLRL